MTKKDNSAEHVVVLTSHGFASAIGFSTSLVRKEVRGLPIGGVWFLLTFGGGGRLCIDPKDNVSKNFVRRCICGLNQTVIKYWNMKFQFKIPELLATWRT